MTKPMPTPTSETWPFWEGCRLDEIRYQYCARCDRAQFPPVIRCHGCFEDSLEWRASKKRGTIHSISSVSRAPSAAFKNNTPYLLALIDLDEGFRIMTNVPNEKLSTARIGMPVLIYFDPLIGDIALPQAALAGEIDEPAHEAI